MERWRAWALVALALIVAALGEARVIDGAMTGHLLTLVIGALAGELTGASGSKKKDSEPA